MRFLNVFVAFLLATTGCKKVGGSSPPPGMATQVVAVKAERSAVADTLPLVGTIRANESVDIKSQVGGIVEKIHFEEGQRVAEGAPLIDIDANKLAASLAQSEANCRLAQSKFELARDLSQTRAVSLHELDEARATFDASSANVDLYRQQMKDTRILAPFSGVVGARMISPGQVIAPQQMLTMIADLDPVKVEFNVPERFISRVAEGQKIELIVAAFPGEKFVGEVYFIAPQLDSTNRAGLVKAKVANSDWRLKPGMFASLDLTLKIRDEAVVIPEAALMPQGDRVMVYVVDEQMTAQLRPVKPGLRQAGRVEIVEGIKEGETVVVEGWQKARPGGKVRLAPSSLASPYLTKETKSPKVEEEGSR